MQKRHQIKRSVYQKFGSQQSLHLKTHSNDSAVRRRGQKYSYMAVKQLMETVSDLLGRYKTD